MSHKQPPKSELGTFPTILFTSDTREHTRKGSWWSENACTDTCPRHFLALITHTLHIVESLELGKPAVRSHTYLCNIRRNVKPFTMII